MICYKRVLLTIIFVLHLDSQKRVTAMNDNEAGNHFLNIQQSPEYQLCITHLAALCQKHPAEPVDCAKTIIEKWCKDTDFHSRYLKEYFISFYHKFIVEAIENPAKFCKRYDVAESSGTQNTITDQPESSSSQNYKSVLFDQQWDESESSGYQSGESEFYGFQRDESELFGYQSGLSCYEQLKVFGTSSLEAVRHAFYYTWQSNHGGPPKFDTKALEYINHIIQNVGVHPSQESPQQYCRRRITQSTVPYNTNLPHDLQVLQN